MMMCVEYVEYSLMALVRPASIPAMTARCVSIAIASILQETLMEYLVDGKCGHTFHMVQTPADLTSSQSASNLV